MYALTRLGQIVRGHNGAPCHCSCAGRCRGEKKGQEKCGPESRAEDESRSSGNRLEADVMNSEGSSANFAEGRQTGRENVTRYS